MTIRQSGVYKIPSKPIDYQQAARHGGSPDQHDGARGHGARMADACAGRYGVGHGTHFARGHAVYRLYAVERGAAHRDADTESGVGSGAGRIGRVSLRNIPQGTHGPRDCCILARVECVVGYCHIAPILQNRLNLDE